MTSPFGQDATGASGARHRRRKSARSAPGGEGGSPIESSDAPCQAVQPTGTPFMHTLGLE